MDTFGGRVSHHCDGRAYLDRKPQHQNCDTRLYNAFGNPTLKGACACPCHRS